MRKTFLLLVAAVFCITGLAFADSLFSDNDGNIDLSLSDFLTYGTTTAAVAQLTTVTAPGLEIDNLLADLVWADNETTPALVTFIVPNDYASGGEFRVLVDESDSTTPNKIDFDVYVNQNAATWDASATNQTPVALRGTAGTPNVITLTPATDFADLRPGKYVTVRIWRDNVADGTGDLELYHTKFYYKKKMGG